MGKVAFITGGNGITGSAILEHLVKHTTSSQWRKIIVTSYSSFVSLVTDDPRIHFVALDFTQPSDFLTTQMREAGCGDVTHAYFSSYVHRDGFAELASANTALFENFLVALQAVTVGGENHLANVTLQTGGKYYNVHAAPRPTPCREDDPRPDFGAQYGNFYYPQEDFLKREQKGKQWTWNVIRPTGIVGCTGESRPSQRRPNNLKKSDHRLIEFTTTGKPNGMNLALTYAVYFLLCAELDVEARMPTNVTYWNDTEDQSDATLIAELTIWASTTPAAANEAFNCVNGDVFRYRYMWPRLASFFGARATSNQNFEKPRPVEEGALQQEFSVIEWLGDKQPVWETLCDRAGIPEAKATFGFVTPFIMDWAFRRSWSATLSMSKARKLGWTGYLDSYESNIRVFQRFRELKQIP